MQIMYGVRGERRLEEFEIPWLRGYENSQAGAGGNAASEQFQLDVYGEVLDAMYRAHRAGIETNEADWRLQVALMRFSRIEMGEPDEGIWEVRGGRQQFTHSKMMAWVAFDRAVKLVENCNCAGGGAPRALARNPRRNPRAGLRARLQREEESVHPVLRIGRARREPAHDAAGRVSCRPTDERVAQHDRSDRARADARTVSSCVIARRRTTWMVCPATEGVFLPCSFWLADCLHLIGRTEEARELFERLLALRNDLGLLSEEYDPQREASAREFSPGVSRTSRW